MNKGSDMGTRLLVIGPDGHEVAAAVGMAVASGAKIRRAADRAAALALLRAGQGADLVLVDLDADVAGLIRDLRDERFHLPVVAYGIAADPVAAVA
ncbi:MAG: sigma-54-dependent Fis family transcriptional regulator, partial [Geminicoccaceae bacterium]|nr:sigma-54-dependent Fis family transcriptional regulator [Geminicoccaceae bacterium]